MNEQEYPVRDANRSQRGTVGWDERSLLLLGVLMTQNQHGYRINDFIERSLCHVVAMKKPTAYALLDRLESGGFVAVRSERAGQRPPRKVYSITSAGRALFDQLLRTNLATADEPTFAGDIGLMFLTYLDRDAVLACLRQRLEKLDAALANPPPVPAHGDTFRLDLALDHLDTMRRADRDWLAATIVRLEREGPPMVVDEPRRVEDFVPDLHRSDR